MIGLSAATWLPIATLVLGYILKSIADVVQHKWTLEKDREARTATRQDKQFERRNTFQRETLLALQETSMDLARMAGQMHHLDTMAFRQTGKWQEQLFSEELAEGHRAAMARANLLAVRVRDDQVRQLVSDFRSCVARAGVCGSQAEGDAVLRATNEVVATLNERIGQILRQLDDEI